MRYKLIDINSINYFNIDEDLIIIILIKLNNKVHIFKYVENMIKSARKINNLYIFDI
jgi:hypothetical protein